MSDGPASAVLLAAGWPGADELALAYGADAAAALRSSLLADAEAWARASAPGRVVVEPGGLADPREHGRVLADRTETLFAAHGGPVLIAWPVLPRLTQQHARAALGDLASDCDLVIGPTYDGACYLLGLRSPLPALRGLIEALWSGTDGVGAAAATALEAGVELGLLRAERGLRHGADVRAALADPLLKGQLEAILRRG